MRKSIWAVAAVLLAAVTSLVAQEPPGWVNLGALGYYARAVQAVLELSSTGTVLADGWGADPGEAYEEIWRSTDSGLTWTRVQWRHLQSYVDHVKLTEDLSSHWVWAVRSSDPSPLLCSTDDGQNWTSFSGPPSNPVTQGNSIAVIGNYLYYGGSVGDPYTTCLYRLNETTLEWEVVVCYPQCDAITCLEYNEADGKLHVFCKDASQALVRVFSYTPSELGRRAKPIGKATRAAIEPVNTKQP
jgi:photosystem II stability/assembly factor-like uncharacterized protein